MIMKEEEKRCLVSTAFRQKMSIIGSALAHLGAKEGFREVRVMWVGWLGCGREDEKHPANLPVSLTGFPITVMLMTRINPN